MTERNKENISKLLGIKNWKEINEEIYPVAKLMDKYLSENTIERAVQYMNVVHKKATKENIEKGILRDVKIVGHIFGFESGNSMQDTVAKQFYEQSSYLDLENEQIVETLNNVRNMYFGDTDEYSAKDVMLVIRERLFDDDHEHNLFAYSESFDPAEKVKIYQSILVAMEKCIDPAALMMSMDSLRKPEYGDGRAFFKRKEEKAIMDMVKNKKSKTHISDTQMEDLFNEERSEIHPMAKLLILKNFTKENIDEFNKNLSIEDMDIFRSSEFQKKENKISAIVFRKIENEYLNPKKFIAKNSNKIAGNAKTKEIYENMYRDIKEKIISNMIRRKDVKKIPGNTSRHFLTNKKVIMEDTNENGEIVNIPINIMSTVRKDIEKLARSDNRRKERVKKGEATERGKEIYTSVIDAKVAVVTDISNALARMEAKRMDHFIAVGGAKYKDIKTRNYIIKRHSKDEKELTNIHKKKSPTDKFITHSAHTSYMESGIKHREGNGAVAQKVGENIKKYITQERMAEMAQKYRNKVIEFAYIDKSKEKNTEPQEKIAFMLPIDIFKMGKNKNGIPFESTKGENVIEIGKENAFVRVEMDNKKKIIEGSMEIINPNSTGKLPGYSLTWKGQATIDNHWKQSKGITNNKTTESKPKAKVTRPPLKKRA